MMLNHFALGDGNIVTWCNMSWSYLICEVLADIKENVLYNISEEMVFGNLKKRNSNDYVYIIKQFQKSSKHFTPSFLSTAFSIHSSLTISFTHFRSIIMYSEMIADLLIYSLVYSQPIN